MKPKYAHDFPILSSQVHGRRLAYLDNAATTLKPQVVVDRVSHYLRDQAANIHRGVHLLSEQASADFEAVREQVAHFLDAAHAKEIVFTSGTTDSLNLLARCLVPMVTKPGDEILITELEHHANIVPWQLAAQERGLVIKAIPVLENGTLDLDAARRLMTDKTKILAFTHTSNALGTHAPIKELIRLAKENQTLTVVDAAQAVAHQPLSVRDLDCDFLVFSGHKLFGPTGVGVLYGRWSHLKDFPPYRGGGAMIRTVSIETSTYAEVPARLEAGTPPIAEVLGLGAAITYVQQMGWKEIDEREQALLKSCEAQLLEISGVRIIGQPPSKAAIVSFLVDGIHPHDLGSILDSEGVAIRAGHHCCQPLMKAFGLVATARASFSFYNEPEDVDQLVRGILRAKEIFGE